MELLKIHAGFGRSLSLAVAITAGLIPSASAGDHHKTLYYLPVQTTAPTVQVAAAPVQLVTLPAKHHKTYLIPTTQLQSVQLLQTTSTVAAAPAAVAAAPVMTTLVPTTAATAVAASPPKAASNVVMINGVAYVPQAGGLVAGSPPGTPVAASPPNADDLGGLTVDQRTKIVDGLKALYIAVKDIPGFTSDSIKSIISAQAAKPYDEVLGTTGDQDAKQKAVDSMTAEAMGATATSPTAPAKQTATAGQQQVMMAVPTAAAPVQYFLPVRAKHHLLHPYQY